jgi:hypothetical protein
METFQSKRPTTFRNANAQVRRYQYFYELMTEQFPELEDWAAFIKLLYSSAVKWTSESAEFRIVELPRVTVKLANDTLLPRWSARGILSTPDALEVEMRTRRFVKSTQLPSD